jgi:hypothetical protein
VAVFAVVGVLIGLLFYDGSVHLGRDAIALDAWRALGTRAGSEVADGG